MNSFYSVEELQNIGFKNFGKNVLISRKASIYDANNISIGNNVRIDDFCLLSGNIELGNYIHISAGCFLFAGKAGIKMEDFSGISSRSAIYAVTDDFSGDALTNPMIDNKFRNVTSKKVVIGKHVLIGTGSTIMPGVKIEEGSSIGAMSLVNQSLEPWGIYAGIPCKKLKNRNSKILELEKKFKEELI